jgi:FlaA1/EpsC-like NDP-sugar epimerase
MLAARHRHTSLGFQQHTLMKTARLIDLCLVSMVFFVAIALSSGSLTWPSLTQLLVIRIKLANLFLFVGYIVLCSAVFLACGFYRSHRLSRWQERLSEVFFAVTVITGVLWLLKWPLALDFATVPFLLLFWLLAFCTLIVVHEILLGLLHLARRRGRNLRNLIIIGEGAEARALASQIAQEASLGYRVLRIIDAGEMTENGRTISDI